MQDIGRLTIGRKEGQSFSVGSSTLVTFRHISMRHQHATLEISRTGTAAPESLHVKQDQIINLAPDVDMVVRFDSEHGRQAKVTITAPKSISIMRSELVNEAKAAVGA